MTISVETVSGGEHTTSAWSDALAVAIGARVGPLLRAAGIDPAAVTCTVESSWPRVHVVLSGPPVPETVEQVLGVRVLDAVRTAGRTVGEVDVHYHEAPELPERPETP